MFEKLQRAFWKALTPDLVPDQPKATIQAKDDADLGRPSLRRWAVRTTSRADSAWP